MRMATKKPKTPITTIDVDDTIPVTRDELQQIVYFYPDHDGDEVLRHRHVYRCETSSRNCTGHKYRVRINYHDARGHHEMFDVRRRYDSPADAGKRVVRFFKARHGVLWSRFANLKQISDTAVEAYHDEDGKGQWFPRVYVNGRLHLLTAADGKSGFTTETAARRFGFAWAKAKLPLCWMLALSKTPVW